jgi:MoaA/NifB/PqqE/SkfB family radical SAM enzyme
MNGIASDMETVERVPSPPAAPPGRAKPGRAIATTTLETFSIARGRAALDRIRTHIHSVLRFRPTTRQLANRLLFEVTSPQVVLPYRPLWLLLYLTDACNLRCSMCPHHTPYSASGFRYLKQPTYNMPVAMLDEILARFPEAIVVSLAGVGEPTLHHDFPTIVERLALANKVVDLTTNGYFLEGDVLSAVTTTPNVREVSVSLNGLDEQEHKVITGQGGFARVQSNVRHLTRLRRETGIPQRIAVSQICSSENWQSWRAYVDLAVELGVDRLYLHNLIDMSVEAPGHRSLYPTAAVSDTLAALRRQQRVEVVLPKPIAPFTGPAKCEWFFKNLSFDARGSLGSCGRVLNPQPQYGSIYAEDDIWNNEYMQNMRRRFLDPSGASVEDVCTRCVENS